MSVECIKFVNAVFRNGYEATATSAATIEMVLAVEGARWGVDEVDIWLRERAKQIPAQGSE